MGFARYQSVFDLCHKIRVIVGKRDNESRLENRVEYDKAYISKVTSVPHKKDLNRGRAPNKSPLWP